MSEGFNEISAVMAALTGVLALLFSFYSKHRDANIRERELKIQQAQFDADKKHQISKEKYQQLFEEKIEVYRQLYSMLNTHREQMFLVGTLNDFGEDGGFIGYQQLTEEKVVIGTLKNLFKFIETNHFLISDEVWNQYKRIYELYRQETAEFDHLMDVANFTPKEERQVWNQVQKRVFEKHNQNIQNLFDLIEAEIKRIKKVIED